MDAIKVIKIIDNMRAFCARRNLGMFIVGSVAYTSALKDHKQFRNCDDLDCVFVYRCMEHLENCPYMSDIELLSAAKYSLANGMNHMFSSKLIIGGIQISADFISMHYMEELADEPFNECDTFRIKLTDAIEKPDNEYRSFTGSRYIFMKSPVPYGKFNLYRLPIHLWKHGESYTGALYNKFIHNPVLLAELPGLSALHKRLLASYARHFRRQAARNPAASLMAAMLFRSRFSSETRAFIDALGNFQEDGSICKAY